MLKKASTEGSIEFESIKIRLKIESPLQHEIKDWSESKSI